MLIFQWALSAQNYSRKLLNHHSCTPLGSQFGKPIWRDGSKIETRSSWLDATWTTSDSAHWQWWRRKTKGWREGEESQRKWISYSNTWCERKKCLSLTSLCFSFLPSPPSFSLLPPPPLTCAPCRLKYASIIVWEIGSRGLWRKVCLGWVCYAVVSPYRSPVNKIYVVKVNWNYHIETIRENEKRRSSVRKWVWSKMSHLNVEPSTHICVCVTAIK